MHEGRSRLCPLPAPWGQAQVRRHIPAPEDGSGPAKPRSLDHSDEFSRGTKALLRAAVLFCCAARGSFLPHAPRTSGRKRN